MIIYIEYVIIDNFILSFLTLLVTAYITKLNVKKINIFIATIVLVLFSICVPILNKSSLIMLLLKLLICVLTCLIVVNNNDLKHKFILFLFTYLTLNLICFALLSIFIKCVYQSSNLLVYYSNLPISIIFLGIYVYFKILLKYFYRLKQSYEIEDYIYQVEFVFKNKKVKLNAFLDSGNMLFDEKYNLPIAIISLKTANKIFNKNEMLCLLLKKRIDGIEDMHYISYSTASTKKSKMPVIKLNEIFIKGKNCEKKMGCMLGISRFEVSNGINYEMLASLSMIK